MMRRHAWLLWLLLVVGLWALLAPRTPDAPGSAANTAAGSAELGYTATGAELVETGTDGQPLYRLQAARIAQLQPDAAIDLTGPRLAYEHGVRGRWTLQADRGTLSADRRSASFIGNVRGERAQARTATLTLRTEALTVDLERHIADAVQPVSLEWGRARVAARGLHADMVSDTFVLVGPGNGRLHY
jgi:LPS export ABC transporter protein LptC